MSAADEARAAREKAAAALNVEERWVVAIEGVLSNDGRGLIEHEITWREPAPVVLAGHVVGQLGDFQRVNVDVGQEIHATYAGVLVPEGFVISCDMISAEVFEQGESELWMKGIIAGAAIIEGETMFGDRVHRIEK